MNFDDYQSLAGRTAKPGQIESEALAQNALGLAGESGECVDLIKKHLFHGHPLDKKKLVGELGDVLWYVSQLADAIGCSLSSVAEANVAKLRARYPEGFSETASIHRKDGE